MWPVLLRRLQRKDKGILIQCEKLVKLGAIASLSLLIAAIVIVSGFRAAAFLRETEDRDRLAPSTGRLIETRSGRIFVQDKGARSGAAVVLIHGTAAWSQLWWRTTDALVASGTVS